MENDDYEEAPALVYVKGHLKSYARLVGLSPNEVLSAFESMKFADVFTKRKAQSSKNSLNNERHQAVFACQGVRAKTKSRAWYGVLGLVALLLLGAAVWFNATHSGNDLAGAAVRVSSLPPEALETHEEP